MNSPNTRQKIYNFFYHRGLTQRTVRSIKKENIISISAVFEEEWSEIDVKAVINHIKKYGMNIYLVKIETLFGYMGIKKDQYVKIPPIPSEEYFLAMMLNSYFTKKKVGSLHELFKNIKPATLQEWKDAVQTNYKNDIEIEINRAVKHISEWILWLTNELTKRQILSIKQRVTHFFNRLAGGQSFNGFSMQFATIIHVAKKLNLPYSFSGDKKDSISIDGEIGGTEVSIKPCTFTGAACRQYYKKPTIYYELLNDEMVLINFDELIVERTKNE